MFAVRVQLSERVTQQQNKKQSRPVDYTLAKSSRDFWAEHFFGFPSDFAPHSEASVQGLGCRIKLAHAAAKITEIRQRTKEPTHPSSHLMAAERTGELANTKRNCGERRAIFRAQRKVDMSSRSEQLHHVNINGRTSALRH